jgi:predicted small secreted protein
MLRFALVGCLMASAFLLVAPAQADPPNVADPTWQTSGGVYAIARTSDRVFLGGAFTQVRPRTGGGGSSQPRVRLAAFDAPTGDLIPSWSPEADNIVWGMTTSPDGTRIYAGGDFTSVDGTSHTHLVALDATTGAVIQSWNPSTNGRVYSIAALGNAVYIGGSFSSVNGSNRQHVAALDTATGQVMNGWNPGANGTVRSLALAPDGSRIYLGGKFSSVGGSSHSSLAAVDTGTGNTLSWKPSVPAEVLSVAATQDRVVAATAGTAFSPCALSRVKPLLRTFTAGLFNAVIWPAVVARSIFGTCDLKPRGAMPMTREGLRPIEILRSRMRGSRLN